MPWATNDSLTKIQFEFKLSSPIFDLFNPSTELRLLLSFFISFKDVKVSIGETKLEGKIFHATAVGKS